MTDHHHTLPRHEAALWQHPNPDMQRWRQGQIIERVVGEAQVRGRGIPCL